MNTRTAVLSLTVVSALGIASALQYSWSEARSSKISSDILDTTIDPPSPSSSFYLSAADLKKTIERANQGSRKDMHSLAAYYSIHEGSDRWVFWFEKIADSGDLDARNDLIEFYGESGDLKKKSELMHRWSVRQ